MSETGHSINLANFLLMINICKSFGEKFNPSNPSLTIGSMLASYKSADKKHSAYMEVHQNTKEPINDRALLYKTLRKLLPRVYGHLYSTKTNDETKKDLKGIIDEITGNKVRRRKLPNGEIDPKHISNSHLSFDNRAGNFERLIELLQNIPQYAPNESELTFAALSQTLADIREADKIVEQVKAKDESYRSDRDSALYDPDSGLLDIADSCKAYIRGLFGNGAPETKSIIRIKFKRPKKKRIPSKKKRTPPKNKK